MEIDAALRPRLKSSVRAIIDLDEGLFLLFEGRATWLQAPVYLALAPLLDGTHDVESIFETLSGTYSIDQVLSALVHLRKRGYLSDDVSAEADAAPEEQPATAFWEHVGVAPSLARSRLARARVSAIAVGEVSTKYLTDLLEDDGIIPVGEGDFMIVATDDYLRPELVTLNARALVAGKAWLLVKPVGMETWIGPLFVPGHTACWESSRPAASRTPHNRTVYRTAQRHRCAGRRRPSVHPLGPARSTCGSGKRGHMLDRNGRRVEPARLRGVDQRSHNGEDLSPSHPSSSVHFVRLSESK